MVSTKEQQMLDDFEEASRLDKILQAYELLQQLEEAAKKSPALAEELESRQEAMDVVRQNHTLVTQMLADLNSDEGWQLAKRKKDTVVHYKYEDGQAYVTTKAETLLAIEDRNKIPDEFVKLVSLFNESDLMPRWFPNKLMNDCEVPKQISTFAKYLHMHFHPPALLPVSKRDAFVLGRGYDMTEHGALAISYESKEEGFTAFGLTVPPPTSKYTRVFTKGVYYVEIADNGIVFKTVSLLDIKLKMIPSFLLNMMSKQGPFDFITNVKKYWKNFEGSEWESRISGNPELYEDVRERVAAYMGVKLGKMVPMKSGGAVVRKKTLRNRISGVFGKKKTSEVVDTGPKKMNFNIGEAEKEEEEEDLDFSDSDDEDTGRGNLVAPVVQMIAAGGEMLKRVSEASAGLVEALFETANDVKETANEVKKDGREFVNSSKRNVKKLGGRLKEKVEL